MLHPLYLGSQCTVAHKIWGYNGFELGILVTGSLLAGSDVRLPPARHANSGAHSERPTFELVEVGDQFDGLRGAQSRHRVGSCEVPERLARRDADGRGPVRGDLGRSGDEHASGKREDEQEQQTGLGRSEPLSSDAWVCFHRVAPPARERALRAAVRCTMRGSGCDVRVCAAHGFLLWVEIRGTDPTLRV